MMTTRQVLAGPTPQLIQHPISMKLCKTTCWRRMIVCSDYSAQGCQRIHNVGIQVEVFATQLLDLLLLLSNRMVEVVLGDGERDKGYQANGIRASY